MELLSLTGSLVAVIPITRRKPKTIHPDYVSKGFEFIWVGQNQNTVLILLQRCLVQTLAVLVTRTWYPTGIE
jgi:hypothetical protein